jgi:hypothetical protein
LKIAIVGPGRCGKDTAAEWLSANTRLSYAVSTSEVISWSMADKMGVSVATAHAMRHDRRGEWFDQGVRLRGIDPAYLARTVLALGDICVGIRDRPEMDRVRSEGLVDLVLWVDRPGVAADPTLMYGPELADVILPNWWGIDEFHGRLRVLGKSLGILRK